MPQGGKILMMGCRYATERDLILSPKGRGNNVTFSLYFKAGE
jgi:hypothetical protein